MIYLNTEAKAMDYRLMSIVILLVMFGLIMVFSSSYYTALTKDHLGDPLHFIKRQAVWAVLGTAAMLVISSWDYRRLKELTPFLFVASCILLVVVLVFAEARNGSKRWIDIGPMSIQPSEIAKIATILFLSYYISENRKMLENFKGFIKCLGIVMIPVLLVVVENFSTALVIGMVGVIILFVASPKIWYFVAMGLPALGGMVIAVSLPGFAYRMQRITTWKDPFADATDSGFQTVQSLYAVASGGFFGLGLGQSRQKLGYIPEAYNDIIFSIVCEELGLFGAAALILLFFALVYKGISIALKSADLFGALVATGITSMVAIQVIINIAVNTNAMPVTGMPLPFISYGGTSLLIMMSCMGLLLSISKYTRD